MYDRTIDFQSMWIADKKSIMETMHRNMTDDINAGYDPTGLSIRNQLAELSAYTEKFNAELMALADHKNPNYWCYLDMVRRGVITE